MNIFKLLKGAKFDYDQIKEKKCYQELKFSIFLFLTTLRVRRNCSDRDRDDKMFIDDMVKYKAYLLESGYASDHIDGHFIKMAKLERKDAMSNDGCRKRGSSVKKKKINFVTTWDPMLPDINERIIQGFVQEAIRI